MIYILLLCAMALGGLLALVSLIAAIVQTARTRWASAAAWAVLMVFLLLGVAGTGVWVAANGAVDAARFAQRKARELQAQSAHDAAEKTAAEARGAALLALTPPSLRGGIDPEFWGQSGMFDWYRRPLRFPYVMISAATLDHASLSVNLHHGKCDTGAEGVAELADITRYGFDPKMLLGLRLRDGKQTWVLYPFDAGHAPAAEYPSEEALLKAAKDAGYTGPTELKTVQEQYDAYWK